MGEMDGGVGGRRKREKRIERGCGWAPFQAIRHGLDLTVLDEILNIQMKLFGAGDH